MNILSRISDFFLNDSLKFKIEKAVLLLAITLFIAHLVFIFLVDLEFLELTYFKDLAINPISAIYTPFSVILIYEVYLLVFYLPKSITIYIGKQYEIITLILIRKIFYDLSQLEFSKNWFSIQDDLKFTVDIVSTLLLFILIFFFYKLNKNIKIKTTEISAKTKNYIKIKRIFAGLLVPLLFGLALYSFSIWLYQSTINPYELSYSISKINSIFFDDFFSVLILTDVLLLLLSFLQSDKFSRVIRNSGFVISTILIKLSFSADGILNAILIVVAVLFGVLILWIYSLYQKLEN